MALTLNVRHAEASQTTKLLVFGYIRQFALFDLPMALQLLVVCFLWEPSIVWRERLRRIIVDKWPTAWFDMWRLEMKTGYHARQYRGSFILDLAKQQYDSYRWLFTVTMPEIEYYHRGDYPHSIPVKIGLTFAEPCKQGETFIWYYLTLQTVCKKGKTFAMIWVNTNVCIKTELKFDQYGAIPFPKLRVAMSFSRVMNGLLFEIWTEDNVLVGSIGYLSWGEITRKFKLGVAIPRSACVELLHFEVNTL